ncbi:phosphate acyltransferase PlsX [Chloroflexota bacterium]
MIIAVDAAGGEYAPHEIVKGAIKAVEEYKVDIALVGRKTMLQMLARRHLKKPGLTIVEANQIIEPREPPMKAIRSKPDSSIVVGINLVKDGTASAFVSAGNTGAVMGAALLNLGKIEGVERSAIGSFINITPSAPIFLIDAGANVDCRPEHLVWFAHLGSVYVREILGISSPRVGLLNNGEEETKGSHLVKESHRLLKKTNLNFIGNIEGQDILKKTADVIVTDGFTGNIVLKTIEGMSDNWLYSLVQARQIFSKAYRLPERALHRDIGMDSWTKRLDYQEYGGACLLGVKGSVVISHGRSQAKAIKNAIGLAKRTAERSIPQMIKEVSSE